MSVNDLVEKKRQVREARLKEEEELKDSLNHLKNTLKRTSSLHTASSRLKTHSTFTTSHNGTKYYTNNNMNNNNNDDDDNNFGYY